jgi:hypothetical protein
MCRRHLTPLVTVGLLALTAGGCVDRNVEGDQVTYAFSWWVWLPVLLAALVAFPLGLVLRRRSGRYGWALLILAPLGLLVLWPALVLDRVKVDSEHFEARYGTWVSPTRHDLRFDDVRQIRLVTYEERARRGKRTKQKLVCMTRDGKAVTVQLGDLVKRAAPEILERAEARGVAITEERE